MKLSTSSRVASRLTFALILACLNCALLLPALAQIPKQSNVVRFAVIGDFGRAGQEERDVSNLVKSWNPAFVITTGDNNYDTGAATTIDANIGQYYHDFIYPYTGAYGAGSGNNVNRFFPVLGNHDWGNAFLNPAGSKPYINYFKLPGNERYYDFVRGSVQFFALDSDANEPDGTSSFSPQADWLRNRMGASRALWKLVYFHHSPYSSGPHGSETNMQWPFRQWGATAVLSGHDHDYERLVVDNFPYFVNGLGGYSLYTFGNVVPGSQARYNGDYGAMLVEADDNTINFRFITRGGLVIDAYTINAPSDTILLSEPPLTFNDIENPPHPEDAPPSKENNPPPPSR